MICLRAQPQLTVRTPKGTHFRQLRAALLSLAAEAELATPASEHWIVQIDAGGAAEPRYCRGSA